jgi:hypothetical protein
VSAALPSPLQLQRRPSGIWAWGISLSAGLAVAVGLRLGPDWPAQEFRAGIARRFGLLAWDNLWYAGHALPGYSLLYPLFASVLGASITGVVAVTAAAWSAERLLPDGASPAARRVFGVAVGVSLAGSLLVGQIPFLLGVAFGLAALLALTRHRGVLVPALAAASSLSSPLAGLFLLLCVPGVAAHAGWRRAILLIGAGAGLGVAALVGGASGPFPCSWTSLAAVLAFCAIAGVASSPGDVVVRRLSATYALAAGVVFYVPTPVGANINRVVELAALPAACWLLTRADRTRRRFLGLVLVPAVLWTGTPVASAIAHGASDPTRQAAYYDGLLTFLRTQDPIAGRLEIPLTRGHWESSFVAPAFPLARGWERQTDLGDNVTLYRPLSAPSYHAWLVDSAVALVALPDAQLDYGGRAEARLLADPPPYLRLVFQDSHWRVWRVLGAPPLVTGAAVMTQLGPASFEVQFTRPGKAEVRLRSSGLWRVSDGAACLGSTDGGWLTVTSLQTGPVTVRARIGPQLVTRAGDCDDTRR